MQRIYTDFQTLFKKKNFKKNQCNLEKKISYE